MKVSGEVFRKYCKHFTDKYEYLEEDLELEGYNYLSYLKDPSGMTKAMWVTCPDTKSNLETHYFVFDKEYLEEENLC